MTIAVWICAVLTIGLTAYSLGYYSCALVFLLGRARSREFPDHPVDSVAVLIPARNEGEAAVRVIRSLLEQDHRGPIEIHLLLRDENDSSLPFLEAAFPGERRFTIAFTGHDSKSAKLNWAASRLSTTFTAILDCDHQARPDWIRSSICLLREEKARIVQGSRSPSSARGFFQLWDSLHQHVGCELFNRAFTALDLTVFFTGTTVVMETGLMQAHPFNDCITEDVDFSYDIVLDGERIIHNPHSGSNEQVSPDLYSFLARRRRWANGHTDAFFRHLRRLWSAPISLRARLQFLYHGLHYLIAIPVFVLHLVIGTIFIGGLSPVGAGAALLSSVLLAALIARTQRSSASVRALEVLVLTAWLFPAAVIGMNSALAALLGNPARAALPLSGDLQLYGLVGLFAPLFVLLIGLIGFRQLNAGTFLGAVLTYPLAFYLDTCGVLLGITDCVAGRQHWPAVARGQQPASGAPILGLEESWRLRLLVASAPAALARGVRRMMKPSHLLVGAALSALWLGGVLYAPSAQIRVADVDCEILEHDGEPWIVPAKKIAGGYCDSSKSKHASWSKRTGSYELLRADDLRTVDPAFWDRLDTTFFCNQAVFAPENVVARAQGGVTLQLEKRAKGDRDYTSASIATKEATFLHGRFEIELKPVKASGVITAFFLYRFDPWQEIDFEFVGRDTTKALLNVYYNPGEEGDLYNYGYRGTPVMIDLGFDAAEAPHRYAIEWEADEIRWFADDRLIHRRSAGVPTPIPHLPMRFHINTWPICSAELAGPLDADRLPAGAELTAVSIFRWSPSPLTRYFSRPARPDDWRTNAKWIQPGAP